MKILNHVLILMFFFNSTSAIAALNSGWSLGSGLVIPALASRIRINPATSIGEQNTGQLYGRYSTVASGPIPGLDLLFSDSASLWSYGGGLEYSLATKNPEIHAGAGYQIFNDHALGLSVYARKTHSKVRKAFNLFGHSNWGSDFQTAYAFTGIGEGANSMEATTGVAYTALNWNALRAELDVNYLFSSNSIQLKPAITAVFFNWLCTGLAADVPIQFLTSTSAAATLGYEGDTWSVVLRASTSLEGEINFSMKL